MLAYGTSGNEFLIFCPKPMNRGRYYANCKLMKKLCGYRDFSHKFPQLQYTCLSSLHNANKELV